jgi:hypothetical protein
MLYKPRPDSGVYMELSKTNLTSSPFWQTIDRRRFAPEEIRALLA